jgi:hypothetical protein
MVIGKSTLEPKYNLDIKIGKDICSKILNESTGKISHECRLNLTFVFTGSLTELPNSVNLIF